MRFRRGRPAVYCSWRGRNVYDPLLQGLVAGNNNRRVPPEVTETKFLGAAYFAACRPAYRDIALIVVFNLEIPRAAAGERVFPSTHRSQGDARILPVLSPSAPTPLISHLLDHRHQSCRHRVRLRRRAVGGKGASWAGRRRSGIVRLRQGLGLAGRLFRRKRRTCRYGGRPLTLRLTGRDGCERIRLNLNSEVGARSYPVE